MSVQIEITTTEVGTTEQVVQLIEVAGAGPQGATGGVPDGGTTGQVLVKVSNADQDTDWSSDYADAAQGQLADSAVQPGDPVSDLTNDANYIDAAGAPVQSVDGFTGTVDLSGEYDALGSASSVQGNLTDHENATTNVHGIADTSQLIIEGDARLTNQRVPVDLSVTDAKVAADADIAPTKINGTAVVDNDPRLTDQRVPTDGSVTDAKITAGGLSPSSVTGTAVIDSDARLSDERTPVDGSVTTAKIDAAGIAPSAVTGTAVIDNDARLSDNRTPVDGSVTDVKVASGADIAPTKIAGTAVIDSDARLSDERTPTDGSVTNAKVASGAAIDQSKIDGLTASLDGKANLVSGKVPQSELPAIALTEVDVVADIPARDALTAQEGDVAVVQDTGAGDASTFIYDGTAWQELLTPGSGIVSVTASQGLASTGGTAPEITIVDGGVTNVKLAGGIDPTKVTGTAVVDADARLSEGAASAETVRSLGTGATQALPGDYDVAGQAPVQSVNTQTGNVTLTASDVNAYPDTNPSNFIDAAGAPVQSVDGLTGAVDLSGNYDVLGAAASVQSNLTSHINDTANPHSVTASQVGLGNVPNLDTTDAVNKAHDQNTDTALDSGGASEVTAADIRAHIDATDNPHSVTKAQVGLGDVDNTADLDKPISTATQSALDDKADNTITITAGTGLDGGGDLTANRTLDLDSASVASLGLADTALQSGDNVSELTNDANYIDSAGAPVQSVASKTGAVTLNASDVGLGNVDNTSDADKPISTATQTALNGKADDTVTVTGTNGLQGGGDLTAARTLELTASALASLNLADSALQSGDPATDIAYDNTTSGLTATTVQGAIDEIVGILANVLELNTGS